MCESGAALKVEVGQRAPDVTDNDQRGCWQTGFQLFHDHQQHADPHTYAKQDVEAPSVPSPKCQTGEVTLFTHKPAHMRTDVHNNNNNNTPEAHHSARPQFSPDSFQG